MRIVSVQCEPSFHLEIKIGCFLSQNFNDSEKETDRQRRVFGLSFYFPYEISIF